MRNRLEILMQQKEAWLGDALLLFYVRSYLLEQNPGKELNTFHDLQLQLVSNDFVASFAHKSGFCIATEKTRLAATRFEQRIYQSFVTEPADARKLVYELCDYFFEYETEN